MTPARRRVTLAGAAAVVLVLAGLASVAALRGGDGSGSGSGRTVAERYLELLSDDTQDPAELGDLVSSGDPAALARAGTLLASARARISDPVLGEAEEIETASTTNPLGTDDDARFERFERYEVTYRLGDEQHRATITVGLPSSGTDEDWRIVTPLSGAVDWNSATWEQTVLDLRVGEVPVTDPDRTSYEPDVQFVHPGTYSVEAAIGRWYSAAAVDLTVPAEPETTPVPQFDLDPTPVGRAAITQGVLSAFAPCARGTTYCPVLDLVEPRDGDLPRGWWRGLTEDPTVAVDGVDVALRDGEFAYLGPTGRELVAFDGATSVRFAPGTRRPGITVPLTLERP